MSYYRSHLGYNWAENSTYSKMEMVRTKAAMGTIGRKVGTIRKSRIVAPGIGIRKLQNNFRIFIFLFDIINNVC